MTIKDLRLMYKKETGRYPDGGDISMYNVLIADTVDSDLTAYIEWLEHVAITHLSLTTKLIPWEYDNKL